MNHTLVHDPLADHQRVTDLGVFGVPTLFFPDGQSLFGPVLIDPPTGRRAVRLWEHVTGWLEFPKLYEIKRPKSDRDVAEIAETFRPYLEARDWETVERPAR